MPAHWPTNGRPSGGQASVSESRGRRGPATSQNGVMVNKPGDLVNLERSVPATGRMGGHFVTGHIDGVGEVKIFEERGKNLYFRVSLPSAYSRYLVDKGCVAVDGCSLTVCEVEEDSFAIWLIPHTLGKTNLKQRCKGDLINLEFDILAKYVEKFSAPVIENIGS